MRSFLALDPPDAMRDALSAAQDHLRCGRHVDAEDLHLTLVFMGDATRDQIEELDLALDIIRPGPVPIRVRGLDTFGSENPRSVHALVEPDPALIHLQRKVETAARRAGVTLPHRRFVPHITLARFAHRMPPEDHARLGRFLQARGDLALGPELIEEVSLYRSTLREDGAVYDLLETYPLG